MWRVKTTWSGLMIGLRMPSMLLKGPGCQTRSRLTEELANVRKNLHAPYYMATTEEKQIDTHLKLECQMYFSENLPGVNPVVMNYKIRHNKSRSTMRLAMRPAKYSLAWPDCFFVIICSGSKTDKHGLDMWGYVRGYLWRKACLLCGLARALIGQSRSVDEYCCLLNSGFARTRSQI